METSRFNARLKTQGEVLKFARVMISDPDKNRYINKVYKLLNDMEPGTKINIESIVNTVTMDDFIKCVCVFIAEHPNDNYYFSNDYAFIERRILTKKPIL